MRQHFSSFRDLSKYSLENFDNICGINHASTENRSLFAGITVWRDHYLFCKEKIKLDLQENKSEIHDNKLIYRTGTQFQIRMNFIRTVAKLYWNEYLNNIWLNLLQRFQTFIDCWRWQYRSKTQIWYSQGGLCMIFLAFSMALGLMDKWANRIISHWNKYWTASENVDFFYSVICRVSGYNYLNIKLFMRNTWEKKTQSEKY